MQSSIVGWLKRLAYLGVILILLEDVHLIIFATDNLDNETLELFGMLVWRLWTGEQFHPL